jgi:hypothetical protein
LAENFDNKPFACKIIHPIACPCLFDEKLSKNIFGTVEMRAFLTGYLRGLEKLVRNGRYDRRKDFTVVIQPSTIGARIPLVQEYPGAKPQLDLSYMGPDCFHWSQKLHAMGEGNTGALKKKKKKRTEQDCCFQVREVSGTTSLSRLEQSQTTFEKMFRFSARLRRAHIWRRRETVDQECTTE